MHWCLYLTFIYIHTPMDAFGNNLELSCPRIFGIQTGAAKDWTTIRPISRWPGLPHHNIVQPYGCIDILFYCTYTVYKYLSSWKCFYLFSQTLMQRKTYLGHVISGVITTSHLWRRASPSPLFTKLSTLSRSTCRGEHKRHVQRWCGVMWCLLVSF